MFSSVAIPTFVGPRHRREDLALARREARQRVVGAVAGHQLGDDLRVERGPPRATRRSASMNSRMSPTRSFSR
jgi:hypothetical protein